MKAGLVLAVCGALWALATPAQAKVLRLTCTDGATRAKYDVAFDQARHTLITTHKDFTKAIDVEKVQTNEDGILVWGMMNLGPASKNVLVHFGKEKWALHFSGYNDQRKDSCV